MPFLTYADAKRAVTVLASVSAKTRRMTVGWFRLVCSNGLVVGTSTAKVRQKHSPSLEIGAFSSVLADGMASALRDQKAFVEWRSTEISPVDLVKWVDGPVAAAWGALAAARVYRISLTGLDGTPARVFRKVLPHERALTATIPVPGTPAPCGDGYEIAQVLAWVAARRGNVAQRLKWRAEIRELMAHLVNL